MRKFGRSNGDGQGLAVGTGGRTNAVATPFRRGRSGSAEFEAMAPELPDASLAAAGRRIAMPSPRGAAASPPTAALAIMACPPECAPTMPFNHLLDTITVMR